jgi:hypothetical protein
MGDIRGPATSWGVRLAFVGFLAVAAVACNSSTSSASRVHKGSHVGSQAPMPTPTTATLPPTTTTLPPYPPATIPGPAPAVTPTTCSTQQLSLQADPKNPDLPVFSGASIAMFYVINISSTSCTIEGYPVVTVLSDGNPVSLRILAGDAGPIQDPGATAVILTPQATAYFGFEWGSRANPTGEPGGPNSCPVATELEISIGGGILQTAPNLTGWVCPGGATVTSFAPPTANWEYLGLP